MEISGNPFISGCGVKSAADFTATARYVVHVKPEALHDYESKKRIAVVVVGVAARPGPDCDLLVELPAPISFGAWSNVTHVSIRANETQEGNRLVRTVLRMVKVLAMLGREIGKSNARELRAAATKRANAGKVGTCQICACEHKLGTGSHLGRIVLHGYDRPGIGYTVGSCFGVAHLPFELSRDALGAWIEILLGSHAEAVRVMAELPKRTTLTIERRVSRLGHRSQVETVQIGKDDPRWGQEMSAALRSAERRVESLAREIAAQSARYAAWVLVPMIAQVAC